MHSLLAAVTTCSIAEYTPGSHALCADYPAGPGQFPFLAIHDAVVRGPDVSPEQAITPTEALRAFVSVHLGRGKGACKAFWRRRREHAGMNACMRFSS